MMNSINDFIQKLIPENSVEITASMKLFGQFIGSWEWRGFDYEKDGNKIKTKGKWIFQSVLNGNAIQDIFLFENPFDTQEEYAEYGTSIRFPDGDGWKVIWIGPMNKVIRIFNATEVNNEIILKGKNERNELLNWIFSDLSEDSFHWRGEVSLDNGISWFMYEELDARRRR